MIFATNFKGPRVTTAALRKRKAGRLKREENRNKEAVRERERRRCRFPLCLCHLWNLFLEVSHAEHKGMGGDPTGERSTPELMILICNWRHKESPWSIDKKTIRWRPLTDAGARGRIAWDVLEGGEWLLFAEEAEGGWLQYRPRTLDRLFAEMRARFSS